MKEKISQEIQKALHQSGKLKITFKRNAAYDVKDLLALANIGIITLPPADYDRLLTAAACRQKWKEHGNRTTVVTFTEKFLKNRFIDRMHRALEKIEVITE